MSSRDGKLLKPLPPASRLTSTRLHHFLERVMDTAHMAAEARRMLCDCWCSGEEHLHPFASRFGTGVARLLRAPDPAAGRTVTGYIGWRWSMKEARTNSAELDAHVGCEQYSIYSGSYCTSAADGVILICGCRQRSWARPCSAHAGARIPAGSQCRSGLEGALLQACCDDAAQHSFTFAIAVGETLSHIVRSQIPA